MNEWVKKNTVMLCSYRQQRWLQETLLVSDNPKIVFCSTEANIWNRKVNFYPNFSSSFINKLFLEPHESWEDLVIQPGSWCLENVIVIQKGISEGSCNNPVVTVVWQWMKALWLVWELELHSQASSLSAWTVKC